MINELTDKIKHAVFTLRFSILFVFVSLFLAIITLIMTLAYLRYSSMMTYTSTALMKYASAAVVNEINMGFQPTAIQTQFMARIIEQGILKENEAELVPYTYYLVRDLPLVQRAIWGDSKGNYIYSEKQTNGTVLSEIYQKQSPLNRILLYWDQNGKIVKRVVEKSLNYDPRTRPWYLHAKSAKKFSWTDTYANLYNPRLVITAASPVYKDQQLQGVVGLTISLEYLSRFITHQKITQHGYSFIVATNGDIIAFPEKKIRIKDVYPLIKKSLLLYQKSHPSQLTIGSFGEPYLISYVPVPGFTGQNWLIGVIIPQDDFTHPLEKMRILTVIVTFSALILGMIIVSGFVTRIVKPINRLVKETEKIERFDLEEPVKVPSRIKEIIHLTTAIQSMKNGLQLFQRYVPKMLVRQLIQSGESIRIGGVRKQLSILFSDIENFTAISETLDPNELMEQLCQYFEALSQIIIREKGTLDKYMGDSIMAFWGAPLPVEAPAYHAALSALHCQRCLDQLNQTWEKQGKPRLNTRIGLHLGEAIVGNIGSFERLNYTALGDTINTANRLEKINKFYHTKIIVSDTIYEEIKDKMILRFIDRVTVRGRIKSACIYELLAEKNHPIPFDIQSYNKHFESGFFAYQHKDWTEAIQQFKTCLTIYSKDTIAPIFINRCEHFKLNPPPSQWNGTFVFNE